jgi:outer membrane scaffolding protein for murein synthesis (MipA/OmpV family)
MGAEHASEVPYFFNTLAARYGDQATPSDRAAASAFVGYVANFVKGGDPNGTGLPEWRRVAPTRSELMQFTNDRGAVMDDDPWRTRLDLVERMNTTQPPPIVDAELAKSDWSGFVAFGVVQAPTYLGSDESRVVPLPLIDLQYRSRVFASVGTTGLAAATGVHLVNRGAWRISTHLGLADRRRESDDGALAGLEKQGVGVNVGGTVRHQSGLFNQSISVSRGLNSGAGTLIGVGVGVAVPIASRAAFAVSAAATVVDDRQMRYTFGISPAESTRRHALIAQGISRLRPSDADPFVPSGGLQSVGGSSSLIVVLSRRWMLAALAA